MDPLVPERGHQLPEVNASQPVHHTPSRPLHHLLGALPSGRGPQEVLSKVVHPAACEGTESAQVQAVRMDARGWVLWHAAAQRQVGMEAINSTCQMQGIHTLGTYQCPLC